MQTSRALFALLALPALLAGCGGSGSSSGPAIGAITGRYTGSYESTGSETFSGTLAVTVDSDGHVTGTTTDTRYGAGTLGAGSRISRTGRLNLSVIYDDPSPTVSTVTVVNVTRGSEGVLTGTGRETRVTVSNPVTVTLTLAAG